MGELSAEVVETGGERSRGAEPRVGEAAVEGGQPDGTGALVEGGIDVRDTRQVAGAHAGDRRDEIDAGR